MGKKNRNRGGGRGRYDEMFDYAGGGDDYQETGEDENYQYSYQDEIDSAEFIDVGNSQKNSHSGESTPSTEKKMKSQAAEERDSWDFIKAKMDQSLSKLGTTQTSGKPNGETAPSSSKATSGEEEKKPKGPNPVKVFFGKMKAASSTAIQKVQNACKRKPKSETEQVREKDSASNDKTTKTVFSFLKKKTETLTDAVKAAAQKKSDSQKSTEDSQTSVDSQRMPEDLVRARRRTYLIIGSITMCIVVLLFTAGILFIVNSAGDSGKQVAQNEEGETAQAENPAQAENQTKVPGNVIESPSLTSAESVPAPTPKAKETKEESKEEFTIPSLDSDLGLSDSPSDDLISNSDTKSQKEGKAEKTTEEKAEGAESVNPSLDELSSDLTVGDIVKSEASDSGKTQDSAETLDSLLNENDSKATEESFPSENPLQTSTDDSLNIPDIAPLKTTAKDSTKDSAKDSAKDSTKDSAKKSEEENPLDSLVNSEDVPPPDTLETNPQKTEPEKNESETSALSVGNSEENIPSEKGSEEIADKKTEEENSLGLDVSALGLDESTDSTGTEKASQNTEKESPKATETNDLPEIPSLTDTAPKTVPSDSSDFAKPSLIEETPALNESTALETEKASSEESSPSLLDLPESISPGAASVSPTLSRSENQNQLPEEMGTPDGVEPGSNIDAWNKPEKTEGSDSPASLDSLDGTLPDLNSLSEEPTQNATNENSTTALEPPADSIASETTEAKETDLENLSVNPDEKSEKKEEKNDDSLGNLGDFGSLADTESSTSSSLSEPALDSGLGDLKNSGSSQEMTKERKEAKYTNYTSVKDDTFWKISEKFYQTPAYEKALSRYNIDVVPNPNNLKEGTVLQIPDVNFLRSCYPTLCPQQSQVVQVPAANNSEQTQEVQYYCVMEGDTLSLIAERLLGDSSRWPEIYRLNADKVQDIDLLPAGVKLLIPANDALPEQKIWQ